MTRHAYRSWLARAVVLGSLALWSCGSPRNPMTDPNTAPRVTLVADLTGPYGDHLAFMRGGQRWALADNLAVQLGRDGTLERKLTASAPIHDLAWSDDGTRLLAGPLIYDLTKDAWVSLG